MLQSALFLNTILLTFPLYHDAAITKAGIVDRSYPSRCQSDLDALQGSKKGTSHVKKMSVIPKEGNVVKLGCPVCSTGAVSIKWWRVSRQNFTNKEISYANLYVQCIWHSINFSIGVVPYPHPGYHWNERGDNSMPEAREVDPDVREHHSQNRVIINEDKELVIKAARPGDEGQYFCQTHPPKADLIQQVREACYSYAQGPACQEAQRRLTQIYERKTLTSSRNRFTLIYILDISVPPPYIENVGQYDFPRVPYQMTYSDYGLKLGSLWGPWGPCEALCGEKGYRRRKGRCMVRPTNRIRDVKPQILQEAMTSSESSLIPCHSTLLRPIDRIFNLPGETDNDQCVNNVCGQEGSDLENVGSDIFDATTESFLITHTIYPKVGEKLVLECYGAKTKKAAKWFNGTRLITIYGLGDDESDAEGSVNNANNSTANNGSIVDDGTKRNRSKRVYVSEKGELVMDPVTNYDNKRYACWVARINTVIYTVDLTGIEVVEYEDYLVMARNLSFYQSSLSVAFIIFLIVQHIRLKKKLAAAAKRRLEMEQFRSGKDGEADGIYYYDDVYGVAYTKEDYGAMEDYGVYGTYKDQYDTHVYKDSEYHGDYNYEVNYYNADYNQTDSSSENEDEFMAAAKIKAPKQKNVDQQSKPNQQIRPIPTLLRYEMELAKVGTKQKKVKVKQRLSAAATMPAPHIASESGY